MTVLELGEVGDLLARVKEVAGADDLVHVQSAQPEHDVRRVAHQLRAGATKWLEMRVIPRASPGSSCQLSALTSQSADRQYSSRPTSQFQRNADVLGPEMTARVPSSSRSAA